MPFASDNFTGTSGTELSAYNNLWTKHPSWASGTVSVESTRAAGNGAYAANLYTHSASPPSANYSVSVDIYVVSADTTSNAGVVARADTATATGYMCRYRRGTGVQLFKFNGSITATQLGSTVAGDFAVGSTTRLLLSCQGSSIKVFKDGVEIISATDSSITAAGKAGLWLAGDGSSVGVHADVWRADSAVSFAGTVPTKTVNVGTVFSWGTPPLSSYFSDGSAPYTYAVQTGTLPTGLSLNSSTGVITGTPTVLGTSSIVIRVTDATGTTTDTNSFDIVVADSGTLTSSPLKNNTGTLLTAVPLEAFVHDVSAGTLVAKVTGLTSDGGGVASFVSPSVIRATAYRVIWRRTDTGHEGLETLTAT